MVLMTHGPTCSSWVQWNLPLPNSWLCQDSFTGLVLQLLRNYTNSVFFPAMSQGEHLLERQGTRTEKDLSTWVTVFFWDLLLVPFFIGIRIGYSGKDVPKPTFLVVCLHGVSHPGCPHTSSDLLIWILVQRSNLLRVSTLIQIAQRHHRGQPDTPVLGARREWMMVGGW